MIEQREEIEHKEGIGGWLILVLIGLIVTPIKMIISFFINFAPLLESKELLEAELLKVIYAETIVNFLFGIFSIVLLFLMLTKSSKFPKLLIIYLISNLLFVVIDTIYVSKLFNLKGISFSAEDNIIIIKSIIVVLIWVPYMLFSSRVKRTFVKEKVVFATYTEISNTIDDYK